MTYTKAACGCSVPAVGSPGSVERERCERHPCPKCVDSGYWVKWPCSAHTGLFQLECAACNSNNATWVCLKSK